MSRPSAGELDHGETPALDEAERVVREATMRWDHRREDIGRLLDGACAKLADRANHELRQILTQVSTDLELLGRSLADDHEALDRIERMLEAIDRATRLTRSHLDRDAVAQLLISIDPEPLDLADVLSAQVPPAAARHQPIEVEIDGGLVVGDREKLTGALGYMLERARREATPDQVLHVRLQDDGDAVEGLVGLEPGAGSARGLVEELDQPLEIEAAVLDLPFVRAVIERHGGTVFAERFGDDGLGLGFRLPRAAPEVGP